MTDCNYPVIVIVRVDSVQAAGERAGLRSVRFLSSSTPQSVITLQAAGVKGCLFIS